MDMTDESPQQNTTMPLMQPKDITENTIRFFSDTEPLAQIYKYKFCGWRKVVTRQKLSDDQKKMFGDESDKFIEEFEVDYYGRTMNEAGANYLFSSTYPSISSVAQTGNLNGDQIYSLWDGNLESIKRHLLLTCFVGLRIPKREIIYDKDGNVISNKAKIRPDGTLDTQLIKNPYEMDFRTIPDTITFLTTLYINTAKSKDGFYIKKMSESYQTAEVIRHGGISPDNQTGGIFNSIRKVFPTRQ